MRVLAPALLTLAVTGPALAQSVTDCAKAHVGVDALAAPASRSVRSFADGAVRVFNIDVEEPVACAKGVAVAFEGAKAPGSRCFYVGCFASLSDVAAAKASYDPKRGLLLRLQYGVYGERGPGKPSKPLNIRINRATESVTVER